MKGLLKRWVVWLLALCVLAVGFWVWWDSGRLKMKVVGRYACNNWPSATDAGMLCFSDSPLSGWHISSTVQLIGWDGKERWRISIPGGDIEAYKHWNVEVLPESDGSDFSYSPDGRMCAASVFEPAGGRILIWKDGKLCGDHHMKVEPGALFDGKSRVDLTICNDGRLFVTNDSYPKGMVALFQGDRLVASGRQATLLKRKYHHRYSFFREIVSPEELKSKASLCSTDNCNEEIETSRMIIDGPVIRFAKISTKKEGLRLSGFSFHTVGKNLQITNDSSGSGWNLPPEAPPGSIRVAISPDGRFVLYCSDFKTEKPEFRNMLEFIARFPGLGQVDDHPVWRDAILVEQPGIVRARGRIVLDEMDQGQWGLLELGTGNFPVDNPFLSSDGNHLALYGHDGLLMLKLR